MIEFSHRRGLWKFQKSLLLNQEYTGKIKKHIWLTIEMLDISEMNELGGNI